MTGKNENKIVRVIMLGAPGSGKGTIAKKLLAAHGGSHISTGDMLRAQVAAGTPLGKNAKCFMDKGELVPDEVVNGLISDWLDAHPGEGFIFDGYPRTIAQATALEKMLEARGIKIDLVANLAIPFDVILRRLTSRRSCAKCGQPFNLEFIPPRVPGICDKCGGPLIQREDEKPEVVRKRLAVYEKQTKPLVDYYARKGMLKNFSSESSEETIAEIEAELAKKNKK
ncbi:MAG: adenylate kinase [Candidatus Norongarragalinales archaeon]